MSNQSHSTAIWREPALSGAAPGVAPVYLVKSGSDVRTSITGPEQIVMYDVSGNGDFKSIDITVPYYLVVDGSGNISPSTTGPAGAIITDVGSNDLRVTTNLTATVAADIRLDTAGNLWIIPRTNRRLSLVEVRGAIGFF